MRRSPNAGGCDFAADPKETAQDAAVFWLPDLLPDAFELRPTLGSDHPAAMPVDLRGLAELQERQALDGSWHGLCRLLGATHHFWLSDFPPDATSSFLVILPLDRLFDLRVEAAIRFWRALQGRPTGERLHDLSPQTRDRHILTLRALDGRLMGASYRQIAEILLGFHGTKADWESDPRKNRTRRLVADGLRYMRGGYRDLLHYPTRLPDSP